MLDESLKRKRMADHVLDAQTGFDTTAEEDARLRQTHLYGGTTDDPSHGDPDTKNDGDDEASRTAEQTIKILREVTPYFWRLHNPEELAKLKEELREAELEGNGQKRAKPRERTKSWRERDDEFWNSDEPKQVMPRKL